tara:strand:- start:148 stop:663 length:516 start_codon:yes stop_codon:yes gene_type:complete
MSVPDQTLAALLIPKGAPYAFRLRLPDRRLNFVISTGVSSEPVGVPVYRLSPCREGVEDQEEEEGEGGGAAGESGDDDDDNEKEKEEEREEGSSGKRDGADDASTKESGSISRKWRRKKRKSGAAFLDAQLESMTRRYLQQSVKVLTAKRIVYLPKVMQWCVQPKRERKKK